MNLTPSPTPETPNPTPRPAVFSSPSEEREPMLVSQRVDETLSDSLAQYLPELNKEERESFLEHAIKRTGFSRKKVMRIVVVAAIACDILRPTPPVTSTDGEG